MKNAAMSPLHSPAGRSCVSRFFTGTDFGSTPFFVRYSEMNHEPVEPTRVATGLPTRSAGFLTSFRAMTTKPLASRSLAAEGWYWPGVFKKDRTLGGGPGFARLPRPGGRGWKGGGA